MKEVTKNPNSRAHPSPFLLFPLPPKQQQLSPFLSPPQISPEKAIFMFVKNVLPPTGEDEKKRKEKKRKRGNNLGSWFSCLRALSASFFSCSKKNPKIQPAALMADVYDEHKDIDGFLYMTFSGENTFGGGVVEVEEKGEEEELSLV